MAFRHVVALQWKPETTSAQRVTIVRELRALPALIDTIRSYVIGEDAGINAAGPAENHDLVIVADFDDVAGYLTYRDHPEHQRVIKDHISRHVAARAAVQHHY
jgi:hypothetical protein